jgi:quinol monooxygenase YgiN
MRLVSWTKEPGRVKYVSSIDINDSTTIHIYKLWKSTDALGLHFRAPHFGAPHFAAVQKTLGGIRTKSMHARVCEIIMELAFPN